MRSLFRSGRGQANVYFAVIIALFTFGFMSIIGYVYTTNVIQGFVDSGLYTGAVAQAGDSFLRSLLVFDKIMVLFMIILVVGVGVTSYKLPTSNVYFLVTFLLSALYGLVSYFFNYMFAQLVSESVFSVALAYFPLTILICTNLHWVILISIVVGSITLYAKRESGQVLT